MGRKQQQEKVWFDQQELMIAPSQGYEATYMVRKFGCYATMIIFPLSWALTVGLMAWQGWPFRAWPFLTVPLAAWACLLALPLFWKMRKATMTTMDAVIRTMEAYLSRAGVAIDLNQDGRVGHYAPEIQPPAVKEYRPIVMGKGLQTTYQSQPTLPQPDSAMRVIGEDEEPTDELERRVWILPNDERCQVEELENFVKGIFTKGWARAAWVGNGKFKREVYEGLIQQIEAGGILTDRTKGYQGKLSVDSPAQALAILGMDQQRGWNIET